MKKLKLITTLSSLGMVAAATPIVATSCTPDTTDTRNYAIIAGEEVEFPEIVTQEDLQNLVPHNPRNAGADAQVVIEIDGQEYEFDKVSEVNLGTVHNVVEIPASFLSAEPLTGVSNLQKVSLSGIKDTFHIDESFLSKNYRLTSLKLPTMSSAVIANSDGSTQYSQISDNFLKDCAGLKRVDFSPLANVGAITHGFLENCSNLQSADLSALKSVRNIGNNFLAGCTSLSSVQLPTLKSEIEIYGLKGGCEIGNDFMYGVTKVTTVNFKPFAEARVIGNNFFSAAVLNLKTIDLSSWKMVNQIGDNFLTSEDIAPIIMIGMIESKTTTFKLPTFVPPAPFKSSTNADEPTLTIGDGFLAGFKYLTSVDLTPISKVQTIGSGFMAGCENVESVDLSLLSKVQKLGDSFLMYCKKIKTLDLSAMKALQSSTTEGIIGNEFLAGCNSLETVNMGDLPATAMATGSSNDQAFVQFLAEKQETYNGIDLIVSEANMSGWAAKITADYPNIDGEPIPEEYAEYLGNGYFYRKVVAKQVV